MTEQETKRPDEKDSDDAALRQYALQLASGRGHNGEPIQTTLDRAAKFLAFMKGT